MKVISLILIMSMSVFAQVVQTKTSPMFQRTQRSINANYSELRIQAHEYLKKEQENALFKNLKWQNLGPTIVGGRITDIAVPKGSYFTFYIAAASGGVWRTENNGTTWEPIFENQSSITIGDIAVSDKNANTIWVGTGENNSLRSSYAGTGVFKSEDGGKSWKNMGLHDSQHIGRIIIHPENDQIVYVAAIGHLYSTNNERGIFKTVDAGKTWEKVLFVNDSVGFIDVSFSPDNPDIVYAAAWERSRKAWNFVESGPGSGIYKSTDAGKSWTKKTKGFPNDKFVGRIGFGTNPTKANIVYAVLDNQRLKAKASEADKSRMANTTNNVVDSVLAGIEVYRSEDYGDSWKLVSEDLPNNSLYSSYGYFFGNMAVDPNNPETLYVMGILPAKSTNGGKNWEIITRGSGVHADHHAMWINPDNSKHIINGNDGGIDISYDEGLTWQNIQNIPIAQFYAITVDNETPYNVYGGMQDNGSYKGSSVVPNKNSDPQGLNPNNHWEFVSGGDGFFVQVDPTDAGIIYSESQWGFIGRTMHGVRKSIRPRPKDKKEKYRFNWNSPILLSKHNRLTLYFGGNKLFKSYNQGDDWFEVSPDLSKQDPNRIGDVTFGTITTISESPFDPEILYVGTDDGNVWVTKNGGTHWDMITEGLPNKWVSRIVASRYDISRVYVTLTGYREDDFTNYALVSEDYGKDWKALGKNTPKEAINVILEDAKNKNVLYLGTDLSVYASLNRGETWTPLSSNLPTTAVYDIVQQEREMDLVIGTHGRGIYRVDAQFISALSDSIINSNYHAFETKDIKHGYSMSLDSYFYSGKKQTVKISILDKNKKLYAKVLDEKFEKGLYPFSWDVKKKNARNRWDLIEKGEYYILYQFGNKKVRKKLNIM